MNRYYYDFRDIFRAPRIALHGKNIVLQMRTLAIAYVGYVVIAYAAMLVDGVSLSFAWEVHKIFPVGTLGLVSLWGKIVWFVGLLWFTFWLLRGNLAVSKSAFEEIRGNLFHTGMESRRFASQKNSAMMRAYLAVLGFIAFMIILGLIAGAVGLIPVVGELTFGLFYGFPYFIMALFSVFIVFLFTGLILTAPAALAVKGEDTLTTLFDGFSVITSRPMRWSLYTLGSIALAKLTSFVLTYFSYRAFQFTNFTTGIFMGDKSKKLFESAIDLLPMNTPIVKFLSNISPDMQFGVDFYRLGGYHALDDISQVSVYLLSIGISLVFLFIISYFVNTIVVGQVVAFIDIRKQTHNENLAELPEDELWDDFSNEASRAGTDVKSGEDKPGDSKAT